MGPWKKTEGKTLRFDFGRVVIFEINIIHIISPIF